ncbi:alpha/beta fold hydrolase [Desulfonatronospira sp.]|uniref:YheT family hydrolase n=1 Tax=Desulfonatronospira sp. TaxID=1962951 RepID=UPI0025B8A693|nr:alpha/beta fold hydrolase [Desulfonatronospira sp.]
MPVLPNPGYTPVHLLKYGHIHTVYPALFRPVPDTDPVRERIDTPDGDFLDIDWHLSLRSDKRTAVVISHGLEGNSRKKYPLGMARGLIRLGMDAVCMNFRGCSGTPNRLPRLYHSGVTDDLDTVIRHVIRQKYANIFLVGFSMGGNQLLKYLGEDPGQVPSQVRAAAAFSVPCDLSASSARLDSTISRIYVMYFMRSLKAKIRLKAEMFPRIYDARGLNRIRTFHHFDNRYTAPLNGFRNAEDYYAKASCLQFLKNIRVPSLLVQARDDPFLTPSCFPLEQASKNPCLFLEIPEYGGHVGFHLPGRENIYWSEYRAGEFLPGYSG